MQIPIYLERIHPVLNHREVTSTYCTPHFRWTAWHKYSKFAVPSLTVTYVWFWQWKSNFPDGSFDISACTILTFTVTSLLPEKTGLPLVPGVARGRVIPGFCMDMGVGRALICMPSTKSDKIAVPTDDGK